MINEYYTRYEMAGEGGHTIIHARPEVTSRLTTSTLSYNSQNFQRRYANKSYRNFNPNLIVGLRYFFCGEGPRSRCYGRTSALRLIVQPCDEDDYSFFLFPSNGAPVE
jgi:hypothetical protein